MRIYLTAGILVGMLAGCSSDQAPTTGKAAAAADESLAGAMLPSPALRAPMSGFASLPDRGELLAYEQVRQVKHKDAYTAYPVAISEAHALRAMHTGEMVVNAPDGEPIRLKYERHEESPDGNWTWIGSNADGASAVITFGEKAVFGVIPQGAFDNLRLTMSAGQSWLVQTDRSKLAGRDGATVRDGGDQLVPPKLAGSGAVSTASMRAEPATAGASAASAVVDILLGYTNGYAAQLGGQSQANTRLVNMTAITNEAYEKSGVNMRVRLVKTLQVNYPDNTDNGDALQSLTGYRAGENGGPIDVDPAFTELREARDETGADLVSLVRAFRTPENAGCGIAWLIGGGETGIVQADEPFGYSIVSDGTDLDEEDDNTYLCREETLAHELGHNMGQAHNEDDSDTTGVHAYSYGYRETSSIGFYTVMAYPQADGSQFAIRHFANPDITYLSRPTGVANQADNVRSLNLSMPIIASFRATIVPVVGGAPRDVDGDSASELLWRNSAGSNNFRFWSISEDGTVTKSRYFSFSRGYDLAATGDFNGDGYADLVWSRPSNGHTTIRLGGGFSERIDLGNPRTGGWRVAGAGDIDGDGRAELLWRNVNASGNNFRYWKISDDGEVTKSRYFSFTKSYRLATTGDFNGDGFLDLVWVNSSNGHTTVRMGDGAADFNRKIDAGYAQNGGWKLEGSGDVNGDGAAELIWRNSSSASNNFRFWEITGGEIAKSPYGTFDKAYGLASIGDYDGNGYLDLVWINASTGHTTLRFGDGSDFDKRIDLGRPQVGSWRAVAPGM